jgi:uracil-DNA glycosylase family 4
VPAGAAAAAPAGAADVPQPPDTVGTPGPRHEQFRQLEQLASGCIRCRLAEGRTQVVFGNGNPRGDLMLVGEAPGSQEDRQGEPFVGRSGQLVDRMLKGIGLRREAVYVTNVIKCLRYNAKVQLGDGSWERIGRLVRSRYDGKVMTVDEDGHLVRHPVTGWHASPLAGRRVFRMTFKSAKRSGAGQASVELTGDHEVLTDKGYVPVEQLHPGALVATGQGLDRLTFDIVLGSLLGDGHIDAKRAALTIGHSIKQEAYARYKAELLRDLSPKVETMRVTAIAGSSTRYEIIRISTPAHRALRTLRAAFYDPHKRVPAWVGEILTPRILAFWYMDDGHLRMRPNRRPDAEIATCGFDPQCVEVLRLGVHRLGINASIRRGRLTFGVDATRRLAELVAPFIPSAMRYKLPADIAATVRFDPSRLRPSQPLVFYDEVQVEDITNRKRTDTTFFCIDVEETHNFVTAGGVVHNCRPPENRDPRADEIQACHPYLDEQVRLVDPKVVVTLGNFASRTLLGTTTGITRLRGRTYPWQGRTLVPTFHPAAALRAAQRPDAPEMAGLEEDFQTVARLLAELDRPAAPPDPEPRTRADGALLRRHAQPQP